MDKNEISKEMVEQIKASVSKKYESLQQDIIAEFEKLLDNKTKRFRFPKALKLKINVGCAVEKITFTGIKHLDGLLYFENNRKKILYDCNTVSVDELMRVLNEIEKQL